MNDARRTAETFRISKINIAGSNFHAQSKAFLFNQQFENKNHSFGKQFVDKK